MGPNSTCLQVRLCALQTVVRAAEGQKRDKLKWETQQSDDSPPHPTLQRLQEPHTHDEQLRFKQLWAAT